MCLMRPIIPNLFEKYKSNIKKIWNILNKILNRNSDKSSISNTFNIDNKFDCITDKFTEFFS